MRLHYDFESMARELEENGMDAEQGERFDGAFRAAKVAAVAVLCARYDTGEDEMLDALVDSRPLNAEVQWLVARMEVSPSFVAYIHSGLPF
jgi:hypothetical protein